MVFALKSTVMYVQTDALQLLHHMDTPLALGAQESW